MAPCFIYYSQKRKKRRKNCSDLDHHGLAFFLVLLGNENHIMNKVDIDQQLGSKRVCVSDEFLVEFKALFLSVFKGGFLGSKTRLFQSND